MTSYEWFRTITFPLLPVHINLVRRHLKTLVAGLNGSGNSIHLLDVGGRKSPYTIGLKAQVTLLDIPQESDTQTHLNLGFTDEILSTLKSKRSNVADLILQDMTQSTLNPNSYEGVICIEVIEHVEEDHLFVKNLSAVVKQGGWAYLTTPNGDFIKNEGSNKNPDHVRHYTKQELEELLTPYFDRVEVQYAVATGTYRVWSLKSFRLKQPGRMIKTITGKLINSFQSIGVSQRPDHTAHLIARCYKN